MPDKSNVQPSIVPFFSIRFSPIEGIQVETNMTKQVLCFELDKFVLSMKLSSPPGEGMVPPPFGPGSGIMPG